MMKEEEPYMNVIYKITIKNLLRHKTRTLLGLLGIIVAISAFTGVATLGASTRDMFLRQEKKLYMDFNLGIMDLSKEEQTAFEQLEGVTELDYYKNYGYAEVPHSTTQMPYLHLEGLQERELEEIKVRLFSGRMPQNENEIVISSSLLKTMEEPWKIGDKVSFDFGQRKKTETQFQWEERNGIQNMEAYGDGYYTLYNWDWSTYFKGETLIHKQTKEMTIVGIITEYDSGGTFSTQGYVPLGYDAFTKWSPKKNNQWEEGLSVRANFKNKQAFLQVITQLESDQLEGITSQRVFWNGALNAMEYSNSMMNFFLTSMNDAKYQFFYQDQYLYYLQLVDSLKAGLYVVIMISAVLFIYNIFAISLAERRKYLGIIASIGATERQKRSSLYFESLLMILIGLPIGILAGVLGIQAVTSVIGGWVPSIFQASVPFQTIISWNGVLTIVLLTIIAIYGSAFLTLKKAGKITAMEAIKSTKEYKINKRKAKKGKLIGHFFGVEGKLAVKNESRNRGTKTIIVSMVITLCLFVGISTYMKYMTAEAMQPYITNSDTAIHSLDMEKGELVFAELQKMDSVQEAVEILSQNCYFSDFPNEYQRYGTIFSFDEQYEAKYWKQVTGEEITHIQWKKGDPIPAIVLPTYNRYDEEGTYKEWEVGKQYQIEMVDWEKEEGSETNPVETISVVQVSDIAPKGMVSLGDGTILSETVMYTNNNIVIIPRTVAKKITQPKKEKEHGEWYYDIFISAKDDVQQMREDIEGLSWNKVNYEVTYLDVNNKNNYFGNIMMILFTGYIVLITIICSLNIINLVNNTMAVRRREMAMLSSVGMTPEGISKMLFIESARYSINAILISIPFLIVIEILLNERLGYGQLDNLLVPWGMIAVGCIGLFFVSGVSFFYSYSKIKNCNMIEELKME